MTLPQVQDLYLFDTQESQDSFGTWRKLCSVYWSVQICRWTDYSQYCNRMRTTCPSPDVGPASVRLPITNYRWNNLLGYSGYVLWWPWIAYKTFVPFDVLYRIVPKWEVFRSYPKWRVMSTSSIIREFRLPPRSRCELRSAWLLCSE